MSVTNVILSGGPLAGAILPVENATPDSVNPETGAGIGGTVLTLSYETTAIDPQTGNPVIVQTPCIYRVCTIQVTRIGGIPQSSGQAVYCGETYTPEV